MLVGLHVKNFAIIDEIYVDLERGLNVLTGETGAGKSLLLGSINVALGGKVTKDYLGKSADYALAELVFDNVGERVTELLRQYELPTEEPLVISRRISDTGRSISKINGEIVNAQIVKDISTKLIDIHGQHEHQNLLYRSRQLALLDRYAGPEAQSLGEEVRNEYRRYRDLSKTLQEAQEHGDSRMRELSMARYEADEIAGARLKPGEDTELEERFRTLNNLDKLREAVSGAEDMMSAGNETVASLLARALRTLSRVSELDSKLSALYENMRLLEEQTTDCCAELADYRESLEGSEEELAEVQERLDCINRLKSKYGKTIEAVTEYGREAEERADRLQNYDEYLTSLTKQAEEAGAVLKRTAARLSEVRRNAAKELTEKITESLADLNFLNAEFEIAMTQTEECGESGAEEIEFLISTNPGEPLRPLAKVASGGELSRIMLGLKAVCAGKDETDTLFFDEIDVGVSGRTAQKVAEKMSRIAHSHQVICITHLPQIAAMADTHLEIAKSAENGRTTTKLRKLNGEETVTELARMLGGAEITDSVLANAREMRLLAEEKKKEFSR